MEDLRREGTKTTLRQKKQKKNLKQMTTSSLRHISVLSACVSMRASECASRVCALEVCCPCVLSAGALCASLSVPYKCLVSVLSPSLYVFSSSVLFNHVPAVRSLCECACVLHAYSLSLLSMCALEGALRLAIAVSTHNLPPPHL